MNRQIYVNLPVADLPRALGLLEAVGASRISHDADVCKLSVIGAGLSTHPGVAATLFRALGERGIPVHAVTTAEIRVTALIPTDSTELAVRVLHTAFGLDEATK